MANVSIYLHIHDTLTIAHVPTELGTFLTLRWPGGSLCLPDYNATCARVARTLAADLLAAADAIDPPVVRPEAV